MQCRKHTQTADYGRIHEGEKTWYTTLHSDSEHYLFKISGVLWALPTRPI
jgi:hypothetical protein